MSITEDDSQIKRTLAWVRFLYGLTGRGCQSRGLGLSGHLYTEDELKKPTSEPIKIAPASRLRYLDCHFPLTPIIHLPYVGPSLKAILGARIPGIGPLSRRSYAKAGRKSVCRWFLYRRCVFVFLSARRPGGGQAQSRSKRRQRHVGQLVGGRGKRAVQEARHRCGSDRHRRRRGARGQLSDRRGNSIRGGRRRRGHPRGAERRRYRIGRLSRGHGIAAVDGSARHQDTGGTQRQKNRHYPLWLRLSLGLAALFAQVGNAFRRRSDRATGLLAGHARDPGPGGNRWGGIYPADLFPGGGPRLPHPRRSGGDGDLLPAKFRRLDKNVSPPEARSSAAIR